MVNEAIERAAHLISQSGSVRVALHEGKFTPYNFVAVIGALMKEARKLDYFTGQERKVIVLSALAYLGAHNIDSPALHAIVNAAGAEVIQQLYEQAPKVYKHGRRWCRRRCC